MQENKNNSPPPQIDESGAETLKSLLDLPATITSAVSWTTVGLGVAAFLIAMFCAGKRRAVWF